MKINIPEARIRNLHAAAVAVGEVIFFDDVSTAKVTAEDMSTTLQAPQLSAQGVTMQLAAELSLYWKIDIPHVFSDESSKQVSFTVTSAPIDLLIPPIVPSPPPPPLKLTVAKTTAENLKMKLGGVSGVSMGPVDGTTAVATALVAPTGGFQVSGLGFAAATFSGLDMPAAEAVSAAVDKVLAQMTVPKLTISGIDLPNGLGGELNLGGLSITTPTTDSHSVDVKLFRDCICFGASVTATSTVSISKLVLPNVAVGLSLGRITLESIKASLELRNISVTDVKLAGVQFPTLQVG